MLNEKQYIVVPTGGANLPAELVVLACPEATAAETVIVTGASQGIGS